MFENGLQNLILKNFESKDALVVWNAPVTSWNHHHCPVCLASSQPAIQFFCVWVFFFKAQSPSLHLSGTQGTLWLAVVLWGLSLPHYAILEPRKSTKVEGCKEQGLVSQLGGTVSVPMRKGRNSLWASAELFSNHFPMRIGSCLPGWDVMSAQVSENEGGFWKK